MTIQRRADQLVYKLLHEMTSVGSIACPTVFPIGVTLKKKRLIDKPEKSLKVRRIKEEDVTPVPAVGGNWDKRGGRRRIKYTYCPSCQNGDNKSDCPTCHGHGRVVAGQVTEGIEILRHGDVDDEGQRIPAIGKCRCGTKIELWGDEECPKCGKLYNSAGQELRTHSYDSDEFSGEGPDDY